MDFYQPEDTNLYYDEVLLLPPITENTIIEPDYKNFSKDFNKINNQLFAIASIFLEKDARLVAYEIASHVCDNEFREKVLNLFNLYSSETNSLLVDIDFYPFVKSVNKYNIDLFIKVLDFENPNIKINLYRLCANVNSYEYAEKISKFFIFLNNDNFYKKYDLTILIESINEFNIDFLCENFNLENDVERVMLCNLASLIKTEKHLSNGRKVLALYKNGLLPSSLFFGINFDQLFDRYGFIQGNVASHKNIDSRDEELIYENLANNEILCESEVNPNIPETYREVSNGTLCYQGDDLFIKKENGLYKLKLSKTEFDYLFPGNSLLTFAQQTIGDCYLLASLYGIINNVNGRERFLNCFSSEENDLLISFPNIKTTRITNYKETLSNLDYFYKFSVGGSLGWKIIEKHFAETRNTSINSHDVSIQNVSYSSVLNEGKCNEVFFTLGFYDTIIIQNTKINHVHPLIHSEESLFIRLCNYIEENKKYSPIITLTSCSEQNKYMEKIGLIKNHSYTLIRTTRDKVFLVDPYFSAGYLMLSKDDFDKYFAYITCCIPTFETTSYPTHLSLNTKNESDAYKAWIVKLIMEK